MVMASYVVAVLIGEDRAIKKTVCPEWNVLAGVLVIVVAILG
jgi:hypothetical protein